MTASWLYLIGALVGSWFTKQALWPVRLPARRAIPSFFAGWLTNELVHHHILWQAVATAVFVALGALEHWPGWVALALTVAQWVGLLVILRDVLGTRGAVEEALVRSLGEDYRELLPEDGPPLDRVRWRALVIPFWFRHPDVERTSGIVYARAGGRDLHLDAYRHRDRPTGRPIVLYLHGGAWVIGNRNQQGRPLMLEMAARGWVGVNADYRLAPWATFPEQLIDVKRAIAWVREHAEELGGDPGFLAIAGGSAGGHLATLAALTADRPELQPGFEDADTTVQAAVSFYGVYDLTNRFGEQPDEQLERLVVPHVMKAAPDEDPERYRLASPLDQIHADAPPFLVVHADRDTLVSAREAEEFAKRLREVSRNPVVRFHLPGAQHAFDVFPSIRTAIVLRGVARFLAHVNARADARADARVDVHDAV